MSEPPTPQTSPAAGETGPPRCAALSPPLLLEAEAITLTVLTETPTTTVPLTQSADGVVDAADGAATCACRTGNEGEADEGPVAAGWPGAVEDRVLIWAPTGRDAVVARDLLVRGGFQVVACPTAMTFCRELELGAGVALVADEALTLASLARLSRSLGKQPAWSDLPLVVFTRRETPVEAILDQLLPTANVTVVERPVRVPTLCSVVRAALRARTRQYQLRDVIERLADADRRKDEFLAILGHELRNPLAAIRNAASLLEQGSAVGGRGARLRGIIERQSHNLTRMIEDLLDVTRVTSGKFVLRREAVDLNLVVARVRQACDERVRETGHAFTLRLADAPVVVDGDPVRLEQVVSNLVHNALKYTPDGGHISLTVGVEGERAVVTVQDDGVGIERAMLPRIFELFTQVPGALDRAQGGLGLGLPLVRRIVAMHGGEVHARSAGLGRGATFTVTLPLLAVPAARVDAPPVAVLPAPPSEPSPRRTRVVVVEDNADIRECMAELLVAWGYDVNQAGDGRAGLELIVSDAPNVAIVDVGLPKLDGYEVARGVRERLPGHRVRLIAMTGYGQPQDRQRALQAGFDEHLVKPVSPDALSRLLGQQQPAIALS